MPSILNMVNFGGYNDLNLVIIVPVFALVIAVAFLLKFSLRKPEVNKKIQNSKKPQKVYSSSKQKEEKAVGEKRDKVVKEKKTSHSPTKSLDVQTDNEAAKSKASKKRQQSAINEKPSKKNSAQNKKQQVTNTNSSNALAKANKKQVDVYVNKEEDGEWQMVTTKKQKQNKQEENFEIATTSVKTTKKSPAKANKQSSNKAKKSKEVTEKNDNLVKVVNGEVKTVEEIIALNSEPKKVTNKSCENSILPSEITKVTNTNDNFDSGLNSTNYFAAATTNVEIETSTAHNATPVANVAFDELGDDDWTDTKPQKKNRRKALRE